MYSNFMTLAMHFLHCGVVGVFVGYEERCFDVTAVGIFTFTVEYFLVQTNIVVVDGVIESYCNHLRNVFSS